MRVFTRCSNGVSTCSNSHSTRSTSCGMELSYISTHNSPSGRELHTSPGFLWVMNAWTSACSALTSALVRPAHLANRSIKSRCRCASWSCTAMHPLVWYATCTCMHRMHLWEGRSSPKVRDVTHKIQTFAQYIGDCANLMAVLAQPSKRSSHGNHCKAAQDSVGCMRETFCHTLQTDPG